MCKPYLVVKYVTPPHSVCFRALFKLTLGYECLGETDYETA